MTRKDYVALANALGDALAFVRETADDCTPSRESAVIVAIREVSRALKADNANFRPEQFREAIEYRARTGKLVKVGQTRFDA